MDSTTNLREQVMIAQFVSASGSTRDHAQSLLEQTDWQLERALSMFFQETAHGPHYNSNTPHLLQNTPATPPHFSDILSGFSSFKLNGQNNLNNISTPTSNSSSNPTNLDGKNNCSISPLVGHIHYHPKIDISSGYHKNFSPSSNLVRNMK